MTVAGLGPRVRALPDGAENCAALTACASSADVAACDAVLAACDGRASQRAPRSRPSMQRRRRGVARLCRRAAGATGDKHYHDSSSWQWNLEQVRHATPLDAAQQHENEDDDELPRYRQKRIAHQGTAALRDFSWPYVACGVIHNRGPSSHLRNALKTGRKFKPSVSALCANNGHRRSFARRHG